MKRIFVALATSTALIATPAVARDNSWYAGLEGGVLFPDDADFRIGTSDQPVVVESDTGWDADVILGYDFGLLRLELEGGYKRFGVDGVTT